MPQDEASQDDLALDRPSVLVGTDDIIKVPHLHIVDGHSGKYMNQRMVGRGGNGNTFLMTAVDGDNTGIQVAVKIFRKISDADRLQAFSAEIERYREYAHPSIIRYYDEGQYEYEGREHPFVVVEYADQTLQHYLNQHHLRRIDRVVGLRFALNIASALKYLHAPLIHVVHRDIKPGNILITGESARLADFGLAKTLEDAASVEDGDIAPYPAMALNYRSPELIQRATDRSVGLTTASDIFQFGTVLYEILTGYNIQQKVYSYTAPLRLSNVHINGNGGIRLESLVNSMLSLDPALRPNAEDVLKTLLSVYKAYCGEMKRVSGWFV